MTQFNFDTTVMCLHLVLSFEPHHEFQMGMNGREFDKVWAPVEKCSWQVLRMGRLYAKSLFCTTATFSG